MTLEQKDVTFPCFLVSMTTLMEQSLAQIIESMILANTFLICLINYQKKNQFCYSKTIFQIENQL